MRTEKHNRNIIIRLLSSQARLIALLSLWLLLAIFWSSAHAQVPQPVCAEDEPDDDAYVVTLCLSEPLENETLSGDVTITSDIEIEGRSPAIEEVRFYLDKDKGNTEPIMIDHDYPYTFVLPSTSYDNGAHTISAEALIGEFVATGPNVKVRFENDVNDDLRPELWMFLVVILAVLLFGLSIVVWRLRQGREPV